MADLVGFGVAIATAMQYLEHFPDRTYKSMLVPLLQEDKRAGINLYSRRCSLPPWTNSSIGYSSFMYPECTFICLLSGEATRKGFYLYDDKRKANPDPEIKKYVEKAREISGVSIDPKVCVSFLVHFLGN